MIFIATKSSLWVKSLTLYGRSLHFETKLYVSSKYVVVLEYIKLLRAEIV